MKENDDGTASRDEGKSKLCSSNPSAITKDNVIARNCGL